MISYLSAHVGETSGNQPLLTLKQAAQYAICTPRYLQNQIRRGRLKALKPTGKSCASGALISMPSLNRAAR